jgi:extracellular elastinolytic metalloproteinase
MELIARGGPRPRSGARRVVTILIVLALAALGGGAFAQDGQAAEYGRHYDLRIPLQAMQKTAVRPSVAQRAAERTLATKVDGLAVTYDRVTGAARSLTSHTGYLSGPHLRARPEELAIEVARSLRGVLGLTRSDLRHFEVTDVVRSRLSGATHIYLRQTFRGIPVYQGLLQVNVNREGRILSVHNAFFPGLASAVRAARPALPAREALDRALVHLGIRSPRAPEVLAKTGGARAATVLRHRGAALNDVTAELVWLPMTAGDIRLTWNFQIEPPGGEHYYDFNVDAATGEVVTRFDWVEAADFRVYAEPIESPQHTTPLPPADARTLVVSPEDPVASPAGWLGTGSVSMDGNNVHACADRNGNNTCDPGEPSCGPSLVCDFPLDLESDPSSSIPAAVTNLFYWTNHVHDLQYQYGFDEESGNFQNDTFGRGGKGSDSLFADAQDGADHNSNCNAFFTVTPDGLHPRMQMYTCSRGNPERDGSLDNGVIVHELGHGIAGRQIAGPSNAGCLVNPQSASEGVSDWLALVYTAEPGDQGGDLRGIGTYLIALAPDATIRPQPYSTDPAVNTYSYESIDGLAFPHGIGSVWAQAAWEMYWALVDAHGFEPDLLDFDLDDPAEAGNKRALFYVNEGFKDTPCHPTFLDHRDAILSVAADTFGGEDVCLLWRTFAAFGLGTDADSHGPGSTKPTNGFSVPPECATLAP